MMRTENARDLGQTGRPLRQTGRPFAQTRPWVGSSYRR